MTEPFPVLVALVNAVKRFSPVNKTGIVIGSISPWVEAILLFYGATKIFTVEYTPLDISHRQIEYLHPVALSREWEK